MSKPKISLIASAARPAFWIRFYKSLLANTIDIEVVFVGPCAPDYLLPKNFIYRYSDCKPAQCYEAAARLSSGELIGWTADDADYNYAPVNCPNALDLIWQRYEAAKNNKLILAMCPLEDSSAEWPNHHFFYGDKSTPIMAPFGFINREWFNSLGGYDRNFICGQSENDIVMRGLSDGGSIEIVEESKLYVHHAQCHGDYPFRSGYDQDRSYLESCWVNEGYGTYEKGLPRTLSPHRLKQVEPFSNEDILTVNQGPAGRWEKVNA